MRSSLNLNNKPNRGSTHEQPRHSFTKKLLNYSPPLSPQNRQLSPAIFSALLLVSLAAGLAIFQIQATAQIPGLAIKLTDTRHQSAEVTFKSRVLATDLAIELVKANEEAYDLSKNVEIAPRKAQISSQIILTGKSSKDTFRQIFPRQYLPREVIESMIRIEKSGLVE